uniref:UBX domain-containing protein n=1 Tax=Globodera pallida TaxID=36090 RepID=A0A183C280_GLOPA
MDYMVTKEGVTVWCTRINGPAFVPFDFVYDLPGHTFFKIKNKGRAFDVEHVQAQHAPTVCAPVAVQLNVPSEPRSVEQSMLVDNSSSLQNVPPAPAHTVHEANHQQQQQQLQDFGNTLLDVSTFHQAEQQPQVTEALLTTQQLDELVSTMSAAATLLPSQQQQHFNATEQQQQQQPQQEQTRTAPPRVAKPYAKEQEQKITKKKKLEKRKQSVEAEKEEEAANLFERKIKVARQNAQYVVLMRSPNSVLAVRNLGVQLFPRQLGYFLDAYRQATSQPYGYLMIDMSASSDPTGEDKIYKETYEFVGEMQMRNNCYHWDEEDETEVVNTPPQPPTIQPSVAMVGTSQGRPVKYAQRKHTQQQQQTQASPPNGRPYRS